MFLAVEFFFFFLNAVHLSALTIVVLNDKSYLSGSFAGNEWQKLAFVIYNLVIIYVIFEGVELFSKSFESDNNENGSTSNDLHSKIGKIHGFYIVLSVIVNSLILNFVVKSMLAIMHTRPSWSHFPAYFMHIFVANWLVFFILNGVFMCGCKLLAPFVSKSTGRFCSIKTQQFFVKSDSGYSPLLDSKDIV
jgi:hypothetical protein